MNRELKKRKKRFWAMCLAVLLLCNAVPMDALAAYYVGLSNYVAPIKEGDIIYPSDIFYVENHTHGLCLNLQYLDEDGSSELHLDRSVSFSVEQYEGKDCKKVQVKTYQEAAGASADPEKVSLFSHWKASRIEESSGGYPKFSLQAVMKKKITYALNGGTDSSENPSVYLPGEKEIELKPAAKDNYDFDGWYTTSDFQEGTKKESITTADTGDITLYAKYKPKTYTITYKLPDGSALPSNVAATLPSNYTYGVGVASLPDAELSGYTFGGWYEDQNCSGNKKTEIAGTDSGNKTLYAKLTPITYTVKFNYGDGEYDGSGTKIEQKTYAYGSAGVADFPQAKKTGHTFDGWYTETSGGECKTTIPGNYIPTGGTEIMLYAHYSLNDYGITYLLPNGSAVPSDVTAGLPSQYTYGRTTEIKKTSGELSNAYNGVVCTGWYKDAALTIPVTEITATESESVTLYGKFEAGLTYELDGGTTAAANPPTYTYGKGVASFQPASKFGYTFGGWYTSADRTESTRVTEIAAAETGAKTLYAKYTPNSWSIAYNGNGGTVLNSVSTARYVYGVGILDAAPNLTATKDNYDFAGWYMTPACTDGTKWEDVCNVTNGHKLAASYLPDTTVGKITLYAKYTPKTYRIEYKLPDGSALPTEVVKSGLDPDYVYGEGKDLSAASAVWGVFPVPVGIGIRSFWSRSQRLALRIAVI